MTLQKVSATVCPIMTNANANDNRRRLADQVRTNIRADFGTQSLLRMFSDSIARAIIDGYVLRLLNDWDAKIPVTREMITELRCDAAAVILLDL